MSLKSVINKEFARKHSFQLWMAAVWLWPLIILVSCRWYLPDEWRLLLWRSSWVLFAGMLQGWLVVIMHPVNDKIPVNRIIVFACLTLASLLLLPYGFRSWDTAFLKSWDYGGNLFFSFIIHFFPVGVVYEMFNVPLDNSDDLLLQNKPDTSSGYGLWGEKTWLDKVWHGGQISDDYHGRKGEFHSNDRARRVSEDIQQFHSAHPDTDLYDEYYWDDILDAESDDYLE